MVEKPTDGAGRIKDMGKFIIEQEFWDIFPDAQIAVILAKGVDNTGASESVCREIEKLL